MGKFSGVAKASIKLAIAYRFEMFITVIIAPISLLVFYFLWKSIYSNTGAIIGGFTFQQLLSYYVLTWVVGILVYTSVDDWMRFQIRSGSIIKEFVKPISYLRFWFYRTISDRAFSTLIEVLPVLLIGFIFFSVKITAFFPLFLISLFFAITLNYLLAFLIGMSAFWIVHNVGLIRLKDLLMNLISGFVLPLSFFPLWFQRASYFMPFQYITYVPIEIWLGKVTVQEMIILLIFQLVWIAILYVLVYAVWKKAVRKQIFIHLLMVPIFFYVVLHFFIFATPRYSLPVMPFMIIFASYFFFERYSTFRAIHNR